MNLHNLLINDKEQILLKDIFLDKANNKTIEQLIKEHTYFDELNKYGLPINNKVLLHGSSGCGKTMTAKAIAQSLGKNILILNLSNIVCSRIGETSQNIKQIFDKAAKDNAVLFLDEFDQIGKARGNDDKDVGEMRRLVNTIIQLIDYFPNNALLICATNHPEIIDIALLRRFQLQISFRIPEKDILDEYYDHLISEFPKNLQSVERKYNISFAEARDHTYTIIKSILIETLEKQQQK
ncbi:AAA family ATPase [Flavobacterium oreochromis]|uniref:ATPase n=2 Tax=Flavobacterium TaxID=237 RepID=A0A246G9C1_9FLAO|nr:ATP-binding protein [Flavobacterium oreochromis]OWP74224.1 ATPase [Flavobacterium oreochromis]OWP74285.1 ATPase [Flavobacterium oreochromis]POR21592.1 ATPase [Flavobacterium columnare]QYS86237.1 AAA family ATPase [Flavobacterium oreochromis]